MKINTLIETPEGIMKFEGELGEAESKLVIQLGIQQLMSMGAFSVGEAAAKTVKEMH